MNGTMYPIISGCSLCSALERSDKLRCGLCLTVMHDIWWNLAVRLWPQILRTRWSGRLCLGISVWALSRARPRFAATNTRCR
jgi:hypothetical protein